MNIFFEENENARLGDFSEAIKTEDAQIFSDFWKFGTPMTISPEIENLKAYDSRTDVWSLGVTLFYMCSFHLPK